MRNLLNCITQKTQLNELTNRANRLGEINKTKETWIKINKSKSIKLSGENAPWFGIPMSEETKNKLSIAKKGKYVGINNKLFGIPKTEEHKRNMGIAFKRIGKWKGDSNPRHLNPLNGEDNGNWQGGITSENQRIRSTDEYKNWRISVFSKDNYICQCCGDSKGNNLESHHIENFSSNEDLRFNVDNGITLCKNCHNPNVKNSFHNLYGTFNNTKEQLYEYIERYKNQEFEEVS